MKYNSFYQVLNDPQIFEIIHHSEKYEKYKTFFCEQYEYFLRAIEVNDALKIIYQHNGQIKIDSLEQRIQELLLQKDKELHSLNFEGCRKAIVIGSSAFPHTGIYIHQNTDIQKIICLDKNEEATYIAIQLSESINISDRLQFECNHGTQYNYNNADIIYISGIVNNKNTILEQIVKTNTNPNLQILVDSTFEMYQFFSIRLDENNIPLRLKIDFQETRKGENFRFNIIKLVKYDI